MSLSSYLYTNKRKGIYKPDNTEKDIEIAYLGSNWSLLNFLGIYTGPMILDSRQLESIKFWAEIDDDINSNGIGDNVLDVIDKAIEMDADGHVVYYWASF